jgi:hypothetical protein
MKLLKIQPYKITEVQVLSPADPGRRMNYFNWFIQSVNDGILDQQLVFFSDNAWFHLHACVNSRKTNTGHLCIQDFFHETPLHDPKVGLWCAISAKQIT